MKFDLIPHSEATNSYDLMNDAAIAIEEEPRRFNWGEWFQDLDDDFNPTFDAGAAYGRWTNELAAKPACGTQACVKGWLNLLTAQNEDEASNPDTGVYGWFPLSVHVDLYKLFFARHPFNGHDDASFIFSAMNPLPGETQKDYAARGVRAIRKFMAMHEHELKAFTISIPPRH